MAEQRVALYIIGDQRFGEVLFARASISRDWVLKRIGPSLLDHRQHRRQPSFYMMSDLLNQGALYALDSVHCCARHIPGNACLKICAEVHAELSARVYENRPCIRVIPSRMLLIAEPSNRYDRYGMYF